MRLAIRQLWGVTRKYLELFVLVGLYLVGLFYFGATLSRNPGAFNSDDLYCFSVAEDLLQGRDMQGWHFTAVPHICPDLLLLLPCQALSSNLILIILAYDFLFYSLLLAALTWLVRLIGFAWGTAFRTACTGALFLLAAHLDPKYMLMAGQMYQPGFHVSAILIGVVLSALVLHSLRFGVRNWSVAAILLLCPVAVFSDRILIVEFLVPMLAALCFLAITRSVPLGRLVFQGFLLTVGMLLANCIRWCFLRMGLVLLCAEMGIGWPRWKYLKPFLKQLFTDLPNLFFLPLLLVTGMAVLWCWLCTKKAAICPNAENDPQPEASGNLDRSAVLFVTSVITLAPLTNVAAVFVHCFDNPVIPYEPPTSRYFFAYWLLPFLFLGLFVQLLPGWFRRQSGTCFRLAIMLFAAYRIGTHSLIMDFAHFEPPYPPLAQTLDRLERERGPLRGLAGYWVARRMNFLTHERVWVRPAVGDGFPYFHSFNPNRYLSDDPRDVTLPKYNFIIVSTNDTIGLSWEGIQREFGEPLEKITVGGDQVWLYDSLCCSWFDRFLEAQLAQRLCRREKYVAPISPHALSIPKPNLMYWASPGNLRPKLGKELEIRFDHPMHGGLLDVAANYLDEYNLDFYRGNELLERLHVPAVPWTGAVRYFYPPSGIQSRLLCIPESLRRRSWDRVVLRPTGPSIARSLGHFLIFDEDVARRTGYVLHSLRPVQ